MRERKMFFPPALRLAAVAIALSAAALALPLPVFAVLDRAAGHSIAVQQDAEALSPAGRSCAAARELYCWRMTWQNTSRTMVEPDSTPASTAPTLAAVQQLQAAGVLPASMADVLLSAMQQTDSCTTYTDDTGQSEYVFTSDENHVTLTLTASGLPVGFTVEQCSFADSALDEIANAYAAFLGGDTITDWETLPLQLHEPCAVRYSVSAQLYLCVARSGQAARHRFYQEPELQLAAGGNLHPLETHHLQTVGILRDLLAAEVALYHGGKQESVLLGNVHHGSVLFVHSSFLLRIDWLAATQAAI